MLFFHQNSQSYQCLSISTESQGGVFEGKDRGTQRGLATVLLTALLSLIAAVATQIPFQVEPDYGEGQCHGDHSLRW